MTPEAFTAWREAIGGRRFLMTLGANVVNTLIFVFTAKLDQSGYLLTFGATVGAYLTANHMQRRLEAPEAKS